MSMKKNLRNFRGKKQHNVVYKKINDCTHLFYRVNSYQFFWETLRNDYFETTYFEQTWSWCSISCSNDSSCSVSWVREFFCPIKVSNFDLSWESKRAIMSSTAFLISFTLSSLAALTDSTLLSCKFKN